MSNKENKEKLREWKQNEKTKLPVWMIWLIRLVLLAILIGVVVAWPRGFFAVIAGLVVFVLIVYYWIRYKIKKWWDDSGIPDSLFPTEVHLSQVNPHQWQKDTDIQARTNAFERAGFVLLGDYKIEEMSSIKMRAFMLESECLYGIIYEDSLPRVLVDIGLTYENGNMLFCTTTPASGLEQPPYKQVIRMPQSASISEMLQEVRQHRTDEPCLPVSAYDFPEGASRALEDENQWRMEYYQELSKRDEDLIENYLNVTGLSGIEWEKTRDRTVFIHNKLSKNEAVHCYTRLLNRDVDKRDYDTKEFHAKKLFDDGERVETFSLLIENLPEDSKPQKVAELSEPLKAHVYLYPEMSEDEDEY